MKLFCASFLILFMVLFVQREEIRRAHLAAGDFGDNPGGGGPVERKPGDAPAFAPAVKRDFIDSDLHDQARPGALPLLVRHPVPYGRKRLGFILLIVLAHFATAFHLYNIGIAFAKIEIIFRILKDFLSFFESFFRIST